MADPTDADRQELERVVAEHLADRLLAEHVNVGVPPPERGWQSCFFVNPRALRDAIAHDLRAHAADAVADERARCAKMAETYASPSFAQFRCQHDKMIAVTHVEGIAAAIRHGAPQDAEP